MGEPDAPLAPVDLLRVRTFILKTPSDRATAEIDGECFAMVDRVGRQMGERSERRASIDAARQRKGLLEDESPLGVRFRLVVSADPRATAVVAPGFRVGIQEHGLAYPGLAVEHHRSLYPSPGSQHDLLSFKQFFIRQRRHAHVV